MSNMVYSKELFHKAYDSTLEADLSMYDNMPYKRDPNLCNESAIALESGNLIKYYKYHINTEVFQIKPIDTQ